MPAICTCGTQLAEDSLFCHKCGKPQREIVAVEPETTGIEPPPPIAAPVQPEPAPVNFHNRLAIQISLLMAVLGTLASFLFYVNWLAAGFFAVLAYRRRTGQPLNLQAGVKLGWITGILAFAIMTLMLAGAIAFVASGGFASLPPEVRNALDPNMQAKMQAMMKELQSPPAVAQVVVAWFAITTLFSMAGGALAIKFSSRSR
jgi:hypothetical protein